MSTMTNRRPFHSVSPYRRSRVVRARSSTIAERWPTNRLKSVLLPTFGRPTMATTGIPPLPLAPRLRRRRTDRRSGPAVGSDVVRPAGVAARSSAACASSAARALVSGVPAIARIRSATSRRSSIGVEVPPVTPTIRAATKTVGSVRSLTLSIWMAAVPAISHRRVSSLVLALERPPTTTIRSTSPADRGCPAGVGS